MIIIITIIACSEVGVLYFLRHRKRLVKLLLVPGWREQIQTILLGHKALGEHQGPTPPPTFPPHLPSSASPISLPTAPSPASSSCPLGPAEGQATVTQVLGGIS